MLDLSTPLQVSTSGGDSKNGDEYTGSSAFYAPTRVFEGDTRIHEIYILPSSFEVMDFWNSLCAQGMHERGEPCNY
jgi:hypothetical protein